jgi:hypothetical protein
MAAVACGCGGSASGRGEGEAVATLEPTSATLGLSYDGASVDAVLIDSATTSVRVLRVTGSTTSTVPLNHTDFGDYAQNLTLRTNPSKTTVVSGGNAYFLGMYGVTVAPLDGSTSATFYTMPKSILGAFEVDGGSVYASACDVANSTSFGRFDANGAWELLFTGSVPTSDDTCANGAMTADTDAVYFSTSQAIRAYSKSDGTVRTVVDLQGPTLPADPLAVNSTSIVWFDWFDTAFHIASKTAETPAQSAALGATTLLRLSQTSDLAPSAVFATDDAVYWLTLTELHRLTIATGQDEVMAKHPAKTGYYEGLATDGENVFFTDDTLGAADGGFGGVVLRSVPR